MNMTSRARSTRPETSSAKDGTNSKHDASEMLRKAAEDGDAALVATLIDIADCRTADSYALRWAARNGHTDCVKLLIPVSKPKADDSLALFDAAKNGKTECVRALIPVSDTDVVKKNLMVDRHLHAVALLDSVIQEEALKATHLKPAEERRIPSI